MFEIASVLLLVVLAVIVFGVCLLLGAPVWLGAVVASAFVVATWMWGEWD